MKTTAILAIILVILTTLSILQMIELRKINAKIRNNPILSYKINTALQKNEINGTETQAAQIKKSLDNVPGMIGFC